MSYEAWGEPDDSPFDRAIEAGWIDPNDMSPAMRDVIDERERQEVEEGFKPEQDDGHDKGELTRAALNYAAAASICMTLDSKSFGVDEPPAIDWMGSPFRWPFAREWWKPGLVRRMLVKSAALIVAEIERLDRADKSKPKTDVGETKDGGAL